MANSNSKNAIVIVAYILAAVVIAAIVTGIVYIYNNTFPSNPKEGDTFTKFGTKYIYTQGKWVVVPSEVEAQRTASSESAVLLPGTGSGTGRSVCHSGSTNYGHGVIVSCVTCRLSGYNLWYGNWEIVETTCAGGARVSGSVTEELKQKLIQRYQTEILSKKQNTL